MTHSQYGSPELQARIVAKAVEKGMSDCASCDHKKHPDGGWCYMFRLEPTTHCLHHTNLAARTGNMRMAVLLAVLGIVKGETK